MKLASQQKPTPTARFDATTKEFAEGVGRTTAGGDYLQAYLSTDQVGISAADVVVEFDSIARSRGSVSVSAGVFTGLRAGRTYLLMGEVYHGSAGGTRVPWAWYDRTNSQRIGSPGVSAASSYSSTTGYPSVATVVITPATDIEVDLRSTATTTTGTVTVVADNGYGEFNTHAVIVEVGATVVDGVSGLEYMDTIEVSSPVASVAFGAGGDGILQRSLDGDVDEAYEIHFYWPKANLFVQSLEIRPNGADISASSSWDRHLSNGTISAGSGWAMVNVGSAGGGTGVDSMGYCVIDAKTGKKRVANTKSTNVAPDSSDTIGMEVYSAWHDTATNITGLTILNQFENLQAGTRFVLYRRVRTPISANSADSYERRVEAAVEPGTATTEYTTGHTAFSGSVIGLTARIEEAVTAGTVVVNLKVDGVTALTVTLDTTNTVSQRIVTPVGSKPFGVDKNISVEVIATGYDNATSITSGLVVLATLVNEGLIQSSQPAYTPGHLDGLALSFTSVTTVAVGIGTCRDSANSANIYLDNDGAGATANITVSGAGGLDTGSEAASTWYAVYVIADTLQQNPTTALLSTNFTSPTMPAGYDVFRRVGAVRNNSSLNLEKFYQRGRGRDRWLWHDEVTVPHRPLNGGNATTPTTVSCANDAPPSATMLKMQAGFTPTATTSFFVLAINGQADDLGTFRNRSAAAVEANDWGFDVPCDTSQVIQYYVSNVADALDLFVHAYMDEL